MAIPSASSLVLDFFTEGSSVPCLKAATSVAANLKLAADASVVARSAIGTVISMEGLDRGIGSLAAAGAIASLPSVGKNARKTYNGVVALVNAPTLSNVKPFAVSALKTVKEGCEVACGFGSKSAKLPKNGLSCVLDVHEIYEAVQQKSSAKKDSDITALNGRIVKSTSGLAFHTLSFAVGLFALVISPYWSAAFGTVYLVTSVVSYVYDKQADWVKVGVKAVKAV